MSVNWWKMWEGFDVKNSKRVKCEKIEDVVKFMIECGIDKNDVVEKIISSVRNYSYNRGFRKDNYKSDGVLKVENKELLEEIRRLKEMVNG